MFVKQIFHTKQLMKKLYKGESNFCKTSLWWIYFFFQKESFRQMIGHILYSGLALLLKWNRGLVENEKKRNKGKILSQFHSKYNTLWLKWG